MGKEEKIMGREKEKGNGSGGEGMGGQDWEEAALEGAGIGVEIESNLEKPQNCLPHE